MKLIDRIRPIADSPQYVEFAELWRSFETTGSIAAGRAHRMILLGNPLVLRTAAVAEEHAKAQVRGPFTLTQTQADQLIIETQRCLARCVRTVLPELYQYADLVEKGRRDRAESHATAMEA